MKNQDLRERIWRGLLILAFVLGTLAILIAVVDRLAANAPVARPSLPPDSQGSVILLPMTFSEGEPSPYPEPSPYVDLQGNSIDLIIGAAILVMIIVGGVVYGRGRIN
jgi:hypothetical protein